MQISIIMNQNTVKPKPRSQIVTVYVSKDSTIFWRLTSCLARPNTMSLYVLSILYQISIALIEYDLKATVVTSSFEI